jgi:hypothetical protein
MRPEYVMCILAEEGGRAATSSQQCCVHAAVGGMCRVDL